ncbi:MAG TPA: hypothetical protein VLK89_09420 [Solirubrobacterales bacterium]|nr:hypothetical protein [Solirubrobacterales bacterium]
MRIRLALQEQLSDSTLQQIDFVVVGLGCITRKRRQLGDIALYSFGKLDLDLGSGCVAHNLANVNAEVGQRLGAILSSPGCATSNALCGESLDLVVGLAIVKDCDLALHLAHLVFQVTQLLEELSGFRPRQERHREPEYLCRPPDSPVCAISQAMCLLTN